MSQPRDRMERHEQVADLSLLGDGVLVVGTGLIGTSIGLALSGQGLSVFLLDAEPGRAALAADLGAGTVEAPIREPALVVVAVPPGSVAQVVGGLSRRYLSASFTDVASIKSQVQVDIEAMGGLSARFVGGHPMAGRERSGAAVARADLFEGRPWVLTPTSATGALTKQRARALVRLCGADEVQADAARHDAAVALVSHLPQVVASLTAGQLTLTDEDLLAMAGQGIKDVTRIAASDAALWTEILSGNAPLVLPLLDSLAEDLDSVRAAMRVLSSPLALPASDPASSAAVLTEMLLRGARGRARLPGKQGAPQGNYVAVQVVITDQPGELARLFTAADVAGINVEDVTIEHAAGHPVGVVELMVAPERAADLAAALRDDRWIVHG